MTEKSLDDIMAFIDKEAEKRIKLMREKVPRHKAGHGDKYDKGEERI
ncbi:MAG: hypothetical protein NTY20_02580 [Candidatus Aenigmarchaeota archaeon]|nr:hypothetical protein [Candidatus Aenigmarchaeota archaeon]